MWMQLINVIFDYFLKTARFEFSDNTDGSLNPCTSFHTICIQYMTEKQKTK